MKPRYKPETKKHETKKLIDFVESLIYSCEDKGMAYVPVCVDDLRDIYDALLELEEEEDIYDKLLEPEEEEDV